MMPPIFNDAIFFGGINHNQNPNFELLHFEDNHI